jgi:predicted porin
MRIMRSLLAAAAAVALLTPASAADLGGNCCADLEERIAELESTVARKGNRKVTLTVSGQVSRSILFVDGTDNRLMVDNFNSPSRFTFAGSAKINSHISAGYLIEIAVGSPEDALISGADQLAVRHNALWIETPVGKTWLGHTGTATDSIVEINLVEAVNVAALPIASWTGFDGGRTQVLKHESPVFGGFSVSASWSDSVTSSEAWDAALRYRGEFGGVRLAAGIGHADDGAGTMRLSGSASVLHVASGIFLTAQAGRMDGGAKILGGTGGISKNWSGLGATTLFAEYSQGDNLTATIAPLGLFGVGPIPELTVLGFGVVQTFDAAALDVFMDYRQLDVAGFKADVVMAGARIKF